MEITGKRCSLPRRLRRSTLLVALYGNLQPCCKARATDSTGFMTVHIKRSRLLHPACSAPSACAGPRLHARTHALTFRSHRSRPTERCAEPWQARPVGLCTEGSAPIDRLSCTGAGVQLRRFGLRVRHFTRHARVGWPTHFRYSIRVCSCDDDQWMDACNNPNRSAHPTAALRRLNMPGRGCSVENHLAQR